MTELNKKEVIKNKQNEIIDLIKKRKGLQGLEFDYTHLSRQMGKFTWWMMSLMTFSPETTILNISSELEILEEYISTLFDGISETNNQKIKSELLEILDKAEVDNPDKLVENFIYDTAVYFLQNPVDISDSDPSYSSFKKAEKLSKRFTDGQYKIVKQKDATSPDDIELDDIDLKKLIKLLNDDKLNLRQKDIIKFLIKTFGEDILMK